MTKAKNPTRDTCDAVDRRDHYSCVRCGRPAEGGSRHHRQLRRHGDHSAANLVLLCGSGTTGCHGWVHAHPADSYASGMLVHSWHEPESVPMLSAGLHGGAWVQHDRGGSRHTMNDEEARERMTDLGLS